MPNIEHSTLTSTEIHEPLGADTASANEVYIADGLGSGSWGLQNPCGGWRYNAIGSGTAFSTPSSYTLCNVAGAGTVSKEFSTNNLGRLTYTGSKDVHVHFVVDLSFKHSTGSGNDCYFAVYKNGSILSTGANAEMVATADSTTFAHVTVHADSAASTNDYFELYLKTASGNITVHSAYMFAVGMPA